jgi:hypothetical protein
LGLPQPPSIPYRRLRYALPEFPALRDSCKNSSLHAKSNYAMPFMLQRGVLRHELYLEAIIVVKPWRVQVLAYRLISYLRLKEKQWMSIK